MPKSIVAVLLGCLVAGEAIAGGCIARSGPGTTALVELYTSEGCASCPPADRWLARLGREHAPARVVPLALHVDYWDYIGWKDPYAKREFSQRQRRLSQQQRLALVYTPQVLLQGRDFRHWGGPQFERALERIQAQPARARLEIELTAAGAERLRVRVLAELTEAADPSKAALYVASYESRLESRVTTGENRGRVLAHDYVALEWRGPYPLGRRELELALLPRARAADSGVVAFVQERASADVLQALMLGACTPPS